MFPVFLLYPLRKHHHFMPKIEIIRLLTLGNSSVGKSSLLTRYTENEYQENGFPTIGIDFRLKTVEQDGRQIRVQIWDSAGQERFHSIAQNYYRRANGIILVYDVTDQKSFDSVEKWIHDIRQNGSNNIKVVLIGNKCELEEKRCISTQQGKDLATILQVPFFETSAKQNLNVETCFSALIQEITSSLKLDNYDKGVNIASEDEAKEGCCR